MTVTSITLRLACSHDAQAIALMSRDLIEAGLGWGYRPGKVRHLIDDADTVVLVACIRESLAGFAIMAFGEEQAHLVLLAVQPAHWRQGIGRRLMDWVIESARTAGIASVRLELRANNMDARGFYRALEFGETLRVPGYYYGRESAIRMVRILRTGSPGPHTAATAMKTGDNDLRNGEPDEPSTPPCQEDGQEH
jgi:[ribosomal protein S18]-alanine N-acetyltransferase